MIRLYTGTPGAGKTLRSIFDAINIHKSEGRQVFHLGIDGMDETIIPPAPFRDIKDWRSLPPGSILIVDEAHKFFPVRSPGKPDEWMMALTEIRHFGIDLWLITQDPRNIDSFVRRLIGTHFHLTRKAGLKGAMVREFQGVSEDPNDYHNRESSQQTAWIYPKHLFQVYKSATLHVVKPKIPLKIWFAGSLLLLCVVGIPSLIYFVGDTVAEIDDTQQSFNNGQKADNQNSFGIPASAPSKEKIDIDPWQSAESFIKAHTPLIPFVPHSAPIYSGLRPKSIPEILCIASGIEGEKDRTCSCFTEQATRIPDVPKIICEAYVKNGSYNPYRKPFSGSYSPGHPPAREADTATAGGGAIKITPLTNS